MTEDVQKLLLSIQVKIDSANYLDIQSNCVLFGVCLMAYQVPHTFAYAVTIVEVQPYYVYIAKLNLKYCRFIIVTVLDYFYFLCYFVSTQLEYSM